MNRQVAVKSLSLAVLLALVTFGADARSESLDEIYDAGNNAFWNGEYNEAITQYEKLESLDVRSVPLSYNLGTSYARVGKLGSAIRHYERAIKLDPGHTDSHHNIAVIRDHIARRASLEGRDADLTPAVGPWRAILDRFSERGAAVAFLVFHLFLFGMLILRRFVRSEMPRLSLGVVVGILSILTVIAFAIAVGKWHHNKYAEEAVVLTSGALEVKEGPSSEVTRFTVEEGSRVTIAEESAGWTRFVASDGKDGWAPTDELGKI